MKKLLILAVISISLMACSSLKVVTNYDKTVDFSKYSTARFYGWKNASDLNLSDMDRKYIETAFKKEFNKRGVELVESESSDLIVSLFIITQKKSNYSETVSSPHAYSGYYRYGYGGYYGYGPGYGWSGAYPYHDVKVVEYTEGTLIVSVYDAAKKEIIWESVGKDTIDEHQKNREHNINYTVSKLMYKFPKKKVKE